VASQSAGDARVPLGDRLGGARDHSQLVRRRSAAGPDATHPAAIRREVMELLGPLGGHLIASTGLSTHCIHSGTSTGSERERVDVRRACACGWQLQAGSLRSNGRGDPGQGLGGVDPVGIGVTGADGVRHERVDRQDGVGTAEQVWSTGVAEACAPLVGVQLDELITDGVVARDQRRRREESGVASPGCFLQGPPQGPPPLTKFCTPYPTRSTRVPMASVSTSPGMGVATGVEEAPWSGGGRAWPTRTLHGVKNHLSLPVDQPSE